MEEATYLMERTWDGPRRLLRPSFLEKAAVRATIPPIDTSIAAKHGEKTPRTGWSTQTPYSAEYTPSLSAATQASPYPSPLTALTIPPVESPTAYQVDRRKLESLLAEKEEIGRQRDALNTEGERLKRASVWAARYLTEVIGNRQTEEQLRERVRELEMAGTWPTTSDAATPRPHATRSDTNPLPEDVQGEGGPSIWSYLDLQHLQTASGVSF